MVDELGKTVVTVYMCFHETGSNGLICYCSLGLHACSTSFTVYPPPDEELRDWLLSYKYHGKKDVAGVLYGFIHALLCVTLMRLKDIEGGGPL